MIDRIRKALEGRRYTTTDEVAFQGQISEALAQARIPFTREERMDKASRIDFMVDSTIGVEVKIKGAAGAIGRQLLRYALTGKLTHLVVITTKPLDLPPFFLVEGGRSLTVPLTIINLAFSNL